MVELESYQVCATNQPCDCHGGECYPYGHAHDDAVHLVHKPYHLLVHPAQ